MSKAKVGDKVKVHYTGSLKNGKVFDSSREKEPLEFTIGEKKLISGFENAIIGMTLGETKKVCIPSKDAYGEHDGNLVTTIEKSQFPPDIIPQLGMTLNVESNNGKICKATITDITDKIITIDANHPLTGKELIFELELVVIA
ncbi:MAG: peptidylprolyl isomerase [Candidatus Scalinduaceae bacterium]